MLRSLMAPGEQGPAEFNINIDHVVSLCHRG
jgi:hypothetical protein